MKETFTKKYIIENRGCYSKKNIKELLKGYKSPIRLIDIINCEDIALKDRTWFLINRCQIDFQTKRELAFELAVVVAPIFNKEYPEDNRVEKCLQAYQDYKTGRIPFKKFQDATHDAQSAAKDAYDLSTLVYHDKDNSPAYYAARATNISSNHAISDAVLAVVNTSNPWSCIYEKEFKKKIIEFLKL